MQMDMGFWVQLFAYAVSFGIFYGATTTRLKALEAKMDQHNSVMERTFRLEESCKSAHHRIDELHDDLSDCKHSA
ncbi:MAG: hypothetical protein RRZ93_04115 [Ruthenibacterium sp.]